MPESDQRPPTVYRDIVRPQWVDRNGHFNAGFYMVAFDTAVGPWFRLCGVDQGDEETRTHGTFTAESHTLYLRELEPEEPFLITAQLLAFSGKKIHSFLRMHRGVEEPAAAGELVATNEILSLHVDLVARRPVEMSAAVQSELEGLRARHEKLGWPAQCGRRIGVDAPRPER